MNKVCFILMGLFFPILSYSQDSTYNLKTVEIISSRVNNNVSEIGKNTVVITSEMISEMPVNSIDELLRQIPGIEVQSRGGFGVQSDLNIRGATFNQVLVLIDGVRLNDPMTGHFNSYIPIGLSEIERIEVLKGPSSSVYGADAVGGVINIITRINYSKEDLKANVKLKAGSNDYGGLDFGLFKRFKTWKVGTSVLMNSSNGESFYNPNYGLVSGAPEFYSTYFRLGTYSLALGKELKDDWSAFIRASYDDRAFNAKYFYTSSNYDESTERTKVFFTQLKVSKRKAKSSTEIDFSNRWGSDLFIFNPLFPSNNNSTHYFLAQINQFNSINEKWSVAYGAQLDNRSVQSLDRGNHSDFHAGAYGQVKFNPIPGLIANLSLRGDYDSSYSFEVSPQFNIAYLKNKINLRGGLGKSIRAADYTERYVSTNLSSLSSLRSLGNPSLKAEQSWNFEAGLDYFISSLLKVSATSFYRIGSNLIDYVATPASEIESDVQLDSNGVYFYAQNIGSVNTFGIESEINYKWELSESAAFNFILGYTFLDSQNSNNDISKYLSSHANHLLNTNVIFNNKLFNIALSALWKDRKTEFSDAIGMTLSPNYIVVNGKFGFNFLKNKLHIDLEVMNIFDENYSDVLGAIMPGRWFIGSMSFVL